MIPWYFRAPQTYDQVKALYESITPLISKYHTEEDDVRPLHGRRYKHERIAKYRDHHGEFFVFYGSQYVGDPVFDVMRYGTKSRIAPAKYKLANIKKYAPLVWWREGEREFFAFRPAAKFATGWIQAVHKLTPENIRIVSATTSKHARDVVCGASRWRAEGNNAIIPDYFDTLPDGHYWKDPSKRKHYSGPPVRFVFERMGDGQFAPVSVPRNANTRTTRCVNKNLKAKHADGVKRFKDWVWTIGPMWGMPVNDPYAVRKALIERYGYPVPEDTQLVVRGDIENKAALQTAFYVWQQMARCETRFAYYPSKREVIRPDKNVMQSRLNHFVNKIGGFLHDVDLPYP